jgi:hypothetical protein
VGGARVAAAFLVAAAAASCGLSTLATAPPPSPTEPPPTPQVFAQLEKNAEGAHGGPPAIDLPALVAVDYKVSGKCTFELEFHPADGSPATHKMSVTIGGDTTSGAWNVGLVPGSYFVGLGEAIGCTYSVTVRAPS